MDTATIYGLIDPRDSRVHYVGVTRRSPLVRLREHTNSASADAWQKAEEFWIAFYRSLNPELANTADGGYGTPGLQHSQATKDKIRRARIGRPVSEVTRQKLRARSLGYKHTPEAIEKIRQAGTGRRHSLEARAKMSTAVKRRYATN